MRGWRGKNEWWWRERDRVWNNEVKKCHPYKISPATWILCRLSCSSVPIFSSNWATVRPAAVYTITMTHTNDVTEKMCMKKKTWEDAVCHTRLVGGGCCVSHQVSRRRVLCSHQVSWIRIWIQFCGQILLLPSLHDWPSKPCRTQDLHLCGFDADWKDWHFRLMHACSHLSCHVPVCILWRHIYFARPDSIVNMEVTTYTYNYY